MALDADQTIIPGRGFILTAAVDTPTPSLDALDINDSATYTGWTALGHTSRENTVGFSKEGGEATQRGSWEDEALDTTSTPVTYGVTINSLQVSNGTLSLAFGGGTYNATTRRFSVPGSTSKVKRAVYIVMFGGSKRAAWYLPQVDITLGDAPEVDVENFFEIQLSGTLLNSPATGDRFHIDEPRAYAPAWVATTAYAVGDHVTLTGGEILEATVAGTSGATEPTAPATVGDTVVDGDVTWERVL